jgi:hypothetical protein
MQEQNLSNHARYIPLYHFVLAGVIFLSIIGSVVNLCNSMGDHQRLYSAALLVVVFACLALIFFYMRAFALCAQDRAIRAEENLRHFAMTGKLLDSRLTVGQIIALRFASDAEFVELARKAADEKMSSGDIKKTIKTWRPDYHRV